MNAESPAASNLPSRRRVAFLAGLLVLLIPAILPLLGPGFFASDDGRFHLYRMAALTNAWTQGVLHPRLFPEFGFGYGQAVLNFYSPAGYWPGAILQTLGIGPVAAAELTIALGFVLAALAMFGYVRSLWGPWAGLLAAVIYTYFPYHIADAYIRGAIPEHLAFIFPPLILWAYTVALATPVARSRTRQALLWAALAWAGLALTHHLTALMMGPVVAAYALLLAAVHQRWRRLWGVAASVALALGLSAAYWLPAFLESREMGLAAGPSIGFANHMLDMANAIQPSFAYFYRYTDQAAIVYPLSWLMIVLLATSVGAFVWTISKRRPAPHRAIWAFHLGLTGVTLFLISSASLFLWLPLTPILGHLQYPWRFLLLTAVGLAVATAAIIPLLPQRRIAIIVVAISAAAIVTALVRLSLTPLPLTPADILTPAAMWHADAAAGQIGATWTGEFLPQAVSEQRWAIGRPRFGAVDSAPLPAPLRVVLTEVSYSGLAVEIDSPANVAVRLHQFAQPGWRATLDGAPAAIFPSSELALATVAVPAGAHRITFAYGRTAARLAGALISLLSVAVWSALAWRTGARSIPMGIVSVALMTAALLLALNGLGVGQQTRVPKPLQTQLEDVAQLIAWEATPARGSDNALDVTLYWLALRETGADFKAFVHLLDRSGQLIAQHDGDPVGGFTPTTRWRPGEIIVDTHRLDLPGTDGRAFAVKAGLYELTGDGVRNLTLNPPTADGRVDLGVVEIR